MVTCGVRRLKHSTADQIFGYYLPDENIIFPLLAWVAGSWLCLGGQLLAQVAGSWHACLGLSRWLAPGPGGQLLADLELSPMHTHHISGGKAYILPYSDDF